MEEIARQTGGMHAREHVFAVADLAAHERHVRLAREDVLEDVDVELAVVRRKFGRGDAADRRKPEKGVGER